MYCHPQPLMKPISSAITMSLLCVLLLMCNSTYATQVIASSKIGANIATDMDEPCDTAISGSQFQASYQITTTDHHTNTQQHTGLILTRFNDNILHQHNQVSFEAWHKNGEYVRYFPAEKRSISYRRGDLLALNIASDIDRQFHLIAPHTLAQLSLVDSSQGQCYAQQQYRNAHNKNEAEPLVSIDWLPQLSLPKSLTINTGDQRISYQLTTLKAINGDSFNRLIADYQDLDFADVGDSESDPFIAKMITQGFIQHGSSGFYSADGEKLQPTSGGHHH